MPRKKNPILRNLNRILFLLKRYPTYEIGDRNPTSQDYDMLERRIRSFPDIDTQTEWFKRRVRDYYGLHWTGIYWDEAYPKYTDEDNRDFWFDKGREWWKIAATRNEVIRLLDEVIEYLERGFRIC